MLHLLCGFLSCVLVIVLGCSVAFCEDDGNTWSKPKILMVNNSLGPHYGGNGLNHGIELQNGPHKGRLALAERFDCPGVDESAPYWRSYVLYSDDEARSRSICAAALAPFSCALCSRARNTRRATLGLPASSYPKGGPNARSESCDCWHTSCQPFVFSLTKARGRSRR